MPDTDTDNNIRREDEIDQRANDMFANHPDLQPSGTSSDLANKESGVGASYAQAGADQAEAFANDKNNATDALRDKENEFGYDKPDGKGGKILTNRRDLLKKLGPVGGLTLLFGGGAGILMTLLTPGLALVHIKETVENKTNTMATVLESRSNALMATRYLGGTDKAVKGCSSGLKLFCRYTGLSEKQVEVLKENGVKINGGKVDKNGNLRGVKSLDFPDGTNVKPRNYKTSVQRSIVVRNTMRSVYPSRFAAFNDRVGATVSTIQKWARNPKTITAESGGDAKENQVEYNQKLQEETLSGDSPLDELPEGIGDYEEAINDEVDNINADIEDGNLTRLPTDANEILDLPETQVKSSVFKKAGKGVVGALNPADVVVGACGVYRYGRALVFAAKVLTAYQMIRFASDILSTADKIKAGEATPNDVAMAMTMLYAANQYGKSFSDSAGYHYAAYGKPTIMPVSSPNTGNTVMAFLTNSLRRADSITGGNTNGTCKVIANPVAQGVGAVLGAIGALFTGGGSAAALKGGTVAGKAAMKQILDKIASSLTEKFATKEAAVATLKASGKDLLKYSGQIVGFAIAGKIISAYLTPYLAHLAAGNIFGGNQNGVSAMDAIVGGAGLMAATTAQKGGMTALTRSQALAFEGFHTSQVAQYVADETASAESLDMSNPYSSISSTLYRVGSLLSPQKFIQNPGSLAAMPSTVFASVLRGDTAYAAPTKEDIKATMDECDDEDIRSTGLATDPLCNPIYGFTDVDMMENTTPDEVAGWMYDKKYIDANGEPTGKYADFADNCFSDQVASQIISPLFGDTDQSLPSECYKDTGSTTKKYWSLYQIDNRVLDTTDNGFPEYVTASNIAGEATKFSVASYNIRTIYESRGETLESETPRYKRIIKNISKRGLDGKGIDIVGMQEVSSHKEYNFFKSNLPDNYSLYPTSIPNNTSQANVQGRTIAYRNDKFDLVTSDEMSFKREGVTAKSPVLTLRAKDGGQTFAVMNTHNSANVAYGRAPSERAAAADVYLDTIRSLAKSKLPIVFTGDFNEGYGVRTSGNTTYQGKWENLFYCRAINNGLMLSAEDKGEVKKCKRPGIGGVDYIYVTPGISIDSFEKIGKPESATDHTVPYAKLSIGTGGGDLRIATFNLLGASHDREKNIPPWTTRIKTSLGIIKGTSLKDKKPLDIVGMQETQTVQRDALMKKYGLSATYDVYPKDGRAPNPIMWNKTKYQMVKAGNMPDLRYFGNKRLQAPWILFKPVGGSDSQSFYVLNTHDPAKKPYAKLRYENAKQHVRFITSLKSKGYPIFFTGDFNSGFELRSLSRDNITYQNKNENLTYCILTSSNLMYNAFDLQEKRSAKCPNPGNDNAVDHIYLSDKSIFVKYIRIAGRIAITGSDHPVHIADIDLSKRSGSSSALASSSTGQLPLTTGFAYAY